MRAITCTRTVLSAHHLLRSCRRGSNEVRRFLTVSKILMGCVLLLGISQILNAAGLNGKLQRTLPDGGEAPVGGVTVTLWSQVRGRTIIPAVSRPNGTFHLDIPAGDYNLELWIRGVDNPPTVYSIR